MSDRCDECGGEMTYCGEMSFDGPKKDCLTCRLRDKIARLTRERDALQAELKAASERSETLRKERDDFREKWQYENARRRDDEGVWLATRDANKELTKKRDALQATVAAYRKARENNGHCGRGWDSGKHMDAEMELHSLGEPGSTQWHLDGVAIARQAAERAKGGGDA